MSSYASDNERAAAATGSRVAGQQRATSVGWRRRKIAEALYYVVLVLAAAAFMLPIVWLVLGSLKLNAEFRAYPIVISDIYIDERTVDVHIRRLRKSVNATGELDLVRTVRAAGYSLDTEPV